MPSVCFRSQTPFAHLPRALDLLYRMDGRLREAHADEDETEAGLFVIRIGFEFPTEALARNYVARIAQMPGVAMLSPSPAALVGRTAWMPEQGCHAG